MTDRTAKRDGVAVFAFGLRGLTFELTPTAEAGGVSPVTDDATNGGRRAYDACRSGSGAERGVMPHTARAEEVGCFRQPATNATPSRLTAEQGRYTAAAASGTAQRLVARGALKPTGLSFL
jgi:hypothetical protein